MSVFDNVDAGRAESGAGSNASGSRVDGDTRVVLHAVRAIRSGNVDAFARIVELYQRRLFALALMLTRQPTAAEELAQDALVRAFTHLEAYDERRPFYPWLATIAVRLSQNWLTERGKRQARQAGHDGSAAEVPAASTVDPLVSLIADEETRRLWRLVAALPSGERTAAMLYYRHEMSVGDIARALGVTGGTVKTLLFRARRRLRRAASTIRGTEEQR